LDDLVNNDIEVCRVEIPVHSEFLLKEYLKYYKTENNSFIGFAIWKTAVFCSLRTKDVIELKMDLTENARPRG